MSPQRTYYTQEEVNKILSDQRRELAGKVEAMEADSEVDNTIGFRVARAKVVSLLKDPK